MKPHIFAISLKRKDERVPSLTKRRSMSQHAKLQTHNSGKIFHDQIEILCLYGEPRSGTGPEARSETTVKEPVFIWISFVALLLDEVVSLSLFIFDPLLSLQSSFFEPYYLESFKYK